MQLILGIGIDGLGPLSSAVELADAARANNPTTEAAVSEVAQSTIIRGAAGGFVTGAGGFSALAVALPVNVVEFYVQAARMVAAIAILRGHDVDDPRVRKAVLQTLVGTLHDSALVEAASGTRGGALTWRVLRFVPTGVLLFASKGIGFRLLRAVTGVLVRAARPRRSRSSAAPSSGGRQLEPATDRRAREGRVPRGGRRGAPAVTGPSPAT